MTLTKKFVETVTEPGRYRDNRRDGLYLDVKPSGSRSWVQRITIKGKRRDMGLGSARFVSLTEARELAFENQKSVRRGGDPLADKRSAATPTFAEAVENVIALHGPSWRGARAAQTYRNSMRDHAGRLVGMKVSDITTGDIMAVLTPIWQTARPTAQAVRMRIATVMKWAVAHGYRADDPMVGVAAAMPRKGGNAGHHRALPYAQIADALEKIETVKTWPVVALCFRFVVLTAVRSGEARGATWNEIDADAATWTIPGDRMKTGKPHRVPLSTGALEILEAARVYRNETGLVFPSAHGKMISDRSLLLAIEKAGLKDSMTVHGLRSSFRDWSSETGRPREVAEAALAHVTGSKVEAAYARSDLFQRRCAMMEAWSDYVTNESSKVLKFRAGLVFCPPAEHREPMSGLAIPFSMWQCAGHGDAAGPGFVR